MGKKTITSVFVIAAAMLLALPTQAQTMNRRDAKPQPVVMKSVNDHRLTAEQRAKYAKATSAFQSYSVQAGKQPSVMQGFTRYKSDYTKSDRYFTRQSRQISGMSGVELPTAPSFATAPTIDANGIITAAPAGESKYYRREGSTLFVSWGSISIGMQDGYVEIKECEDGTVYIRQPLCELTPSHDNWVKGTKEGDKIVVPVGQPMAFNTGYNTTLSLYWASVNAEGYIVKNEERETVTYAIDGDKIALVDSDEMNFLSAFWDDDDSWQCGEYETIWTLDADFDASIYEKVEAPEGLETEEWFVVGTKNDGYDAVLYKTKANVGFAGDDIYVQGLFSSYPTVWVKGTIKDGVATFKSMQYLGFNDDYAIDLWATGGVLADAETAIVTDFSFIYDEEAKTLTQVGTLFENAATDRIYYLSIYEDLVITANDPVKPVEEFPYLNFFDTTVQQAFFNIIDANGDNSTWEIAGGQAVYSYSTTNNGNDWLISGAIKLEAGKDYTFSIDAAAGNSFYQPESFEVLVGKAATPDAMTIEVIPATDVTDLAFTTYTGIIKVEEDGYYHVGIHCISPADKFRLYVDNMIISTATTKASPAAPRINVQPDPYGVKKSVITVVAPTLSVSGKELTNNLSKLSVLRNGQVIKTFEDVRPGATKVFVDWLDEDAVAGANSYMAIPYDQDGNAGAMTANSTYFVGLDIPAAVEDVECYDTTEGVHISWDPVTTGFNGGTVVPNEIEYEVWTGHTEIVFIYEMLVLDEKVATTKDTEIELPTEQDGDQAIGYYYVVASNEAGRVTDDYAAPAYYFSGKPYALPFEENFSAAGWNFATWFIPAITEDANYANSEVASDGDGGALELNAASADQMFAMTPGKVAMRQGNPTFIMDVMGDGSEKNSLSLFVELPNGESELVDQFIPSSEEEYETWSVSLAEYADQPFIKPIIIANWAEDGYMIVDNLKILDLMEYNLIAKIDAPKTVQAGQTAKVNITVVNYGQNAAENYTVKLFADKDQLLNLVVMDDPIASFEKKTFEGELETTIFDDPAEITLRAEVAFDLDLDEEDNAAETIITLKQSPVSQPEDVKAEKTDEGIVLTWKAPANTAEEVTESFEDGMGGWTSLDADADGNGWSIQNADDSGIKTFEGKYSIVSASYINNVGALTPDNWLISPYAVLDGTFSFKAIGQDANYCAEVFGVYVSTTGTAPEDFVQVGEDFVATGEWAEYSVDLSEFAGKTGYIAIRHYNVTDMYVLVIDNITFTKKAEDIASYNLYVDGEDGVFESTEELTYTFKNLGNAKWVAVSAVQANGKESRPVVVDLSDLKVINAIEQIAGTQKAVDVYTIDGKLLRQQTTDLSGLKGLYIINGQKVLVK